MSRNSKIGVLLLDSSHLDDIRTFASQFGDVFVVMPYEVRLDLDILFVHSKLPSTSPITSKDVSYSKDLTNFYSLYYPKYKDSDIPVFALENACIEAWKILGGSLVGNITGHNGLHGILNKKDKIYLKVDSDHSIGLVDNAALATPIAHEFRGSKNTFETCKPIDYDKHLGFVEIFESSYLSGCMNPTHIKENKYSSKVYEETKCMYGDLITLRLILKILRKHGTAAVPV
jgi:hypothetical protein